MIFKSIRWRLQVWYGVLLVALLVGFGVTAYQLERNRVMEIIDSELHTRLDALAGSLESGHHDRPPPRDDFPGPPTPEDLLPYGQLGREMPRDFKLSPRAEMLFGGDGARAIYKSTNGATVSLGGHGGTRYYYVIYRRDRRILAASTNAPPAPICA